MATVAVKGLMSPYLEAVLVHVAVGARRSTFRLAEQYKVLEEKDSSKTLAASLPDGELVLT